MSTAEAQLISRIVKGGHKEFADILRWGIQEDDFLTQENRGMFRHIVGVHQSPGSARSLPGLNTIADQFPSWVCCDDDSMDTDALCTLVRNHRLAIDIKRAAQEAIENADMNPVQAAAFMQNSLNKVMNLGSHKATDVLFGSAFDQIMHDYSMQESGMVTSRAAWPWATLQLVTGGLQDEDYVVFYGRPKSMKSWVLCYLISEFFQSGKKVLFYTKEMTPKNMYKRIASCLACVPYQEFRSAKLNLDQRDSLMRLYSSVQDFNDQLVCLSGKDVASGGDTVGWLRAKAEYYKPDIIAIDGFALMSGGKASDRHDMKVMSISREISQMRLALQIPVLATCHANRKAAGHNRAELDEVAYSDAIGQDATILARVINEKNKPTIALVLGGSREFELPGIRIGGIPATDFNEKEILSSKEIEKASENDMGESDAPETHAKARTPKTKKDKETEKISKSISKNLDTIK